MRDKRRFANVGELKVCAKTGGNIRTVEYVFVIK
jgi:hypothetical protein